MTAFAILEIYFRLKRGELPDFRPSVFLFGAKSAPSYFRAKGIIKFINEIAKKIDGDPDVRDKLQIVFVCNYDVSYAEKIVAGSDVSLQVSTAGLEASGTGNMKFMMNGAVTCGTMDGANIEIVERAGRENNYIFGAEVEEIARLKGAVRFAHRRRELAQARPLFYHARPARICGQAAGNQCRIRSAILRPQAIYQCGIGGVFLVRPFRPRIRGKDLGPLNVFDCSGS